MSDLNDGVWFAEPDHPVCEACTSSLDREEWCHECGGEGWIARDDDEDWDQHGNRLVTCPECFGEPSGWFCPTCHRRWAFNQIQCEEE